MTLPSDILQRAALPRPVLWLIRIGVSAGLLALLWNVADGPAAARRLAAADPGWLVAAFAALNLQTLACALRWRLTATQLGQSFGIRHAVGEYYLAQLLNLTLPGGVVGDAGRAMRSRHDAGLIRAGQAVILERVSGQIALFSVLIVSLAITFVAPGGLVWPWQAAAVAAATCALLPLAPIVGSALSRLSDRLSRAMRDFANAAAVALFAPRVWPRQAVLSLVTVACNLSGFWFCAEATGTTLSFAATLTVVPLILSTMLIPVSVGGWGLREAATAALWPLIGASADAGVAASIAFGLMMSAASLPGVATLLTTKQTYHRRSK